MDCSFKQKNRYELSLEKSNEEQKIKNINEIEKMINYLDSIKNYEVKDIGIQTSNTTKNIIIKIQKSLEKLQHNLE